MGEFTSNKRKVSLEEQCYDGLEVKSHVMERAKEIQANLAPEFPSFIQTMSEANVSRRFGIRLPKEFGALHLPPHDTTLHFVDERGTEYIVDSHVEKSGRCQLSGGWKRFSIDNKLLEGDVLIFQLVNPSKFKVHIVRAIDLTERDGALGLLNLARANQSNLNDHADERNGGPPPMNIVQENLLRKKGIMTIEQESADEKNGGPPQMNIVQENLVDDHADERNGGPPPMNIVQENLLRKKGIMTIEQESADEKNGGPPQMNIVQENLSRKKRKRKKGNMTIEQESPMTLERNLADPAEIGNEDLRSEMLDLLAVPENPSKKERRRRKKYIVEENMKQESQMTLKTNLADPSEIGNEDLRSGMSDLLAVFDKMGSIENFIISLNGSIIQSELSDYHRTKYYELCCTQNSFLHNNLLKTITCKLAAEIISQTVCIADAIKACKLSTSRPEYLTWDKTLEGFALLGMNVGFLRAKISRLLSIAFESKEALNLKKLRESRIQESCVEDEIKALKLKLSELKRAAKELEIDLGTPEVNAERLEVMFQEEVNAPWL